MVGRFDDGKEADALRTIGEVSEGLGIKAHVLRYWEQQFPMLNPLKRSGGRRYYRAEDIAMVEMIDRLVNNEGYTLKGAKAALRSGKAAPAMPMPDKPEMCVEHAGTKAADILPQLKAIRARLAAALEG
jgi:DNA-binding transcriptional MerR regulator